MRNCIVGIAMNLVTCLGANNSASANERYYMIVFGSQAEPNLPRFSHTFAAFAKVNSDGKDAKKDKIEISTISWLPATLNIMPLRLKPEEGKNFGLAETLKCTKSTNAQTTAWGPFPIKKELYDMVQTRIKLLNSGKISYIVLDGRFRGMAATNCIHALSDVDVTQSLLDTGTAHGEAASELVFQHLEKWVVRTGQDLRWLTNNLDLAKYDVRYAKLKADIAR